jgi:HSP20 family protein
MLLEKSFFDDTFFDDLFDVSQSINRILNYDDAYVPASSYPALNIYEDENNYYVQAELPGFDIKDINLNVSKTALTIEGSRKKCAEDKDASYYINERGVGSFNRSLSINKNIDRDKVSAKMKNGILNVILPKAEEEKPKQISINLE